MTKKQYRTPKVSVGTVKKSIAAMTSRWFLRKVSQRLVGSAGLGARRTHRETGTDRYLKHTFPKTRAEQPAQPLILHRASCARSVFRNHLVFEATNFRKPVSGLAVIRWTRRGCMKRIDNIGRFSAQCR
jgi:hypothetical protein